MSTPLSCHVERHFPVAVVRLCGTLDRWTTTQARTTLSRCLAEQPTALVIDVAELMVNDEVVLGLLPAIADRAADWPGAHVLICAAGPKLADSLARMARSVGTFASRAEAIDAAGRWPVPPRVRQLYLPARDAPQHARTVVGTACATWGVAAAAGAAQLVASELVANAVVHARTLLELSVVLRQPYLYLSVRDGDDRRLRLSGPVGDGAEHGRGLLVIDALAAAWGTIRTGDGKVVWATLRIGPG